MISFWRLSCLAKKNITTTNVASTKNVTISLACLKAVAAGVVDRRDNEDQKDKEYEMGQQPRPTEHRLERGGTGDLTPCHAP